MAVRPAGAKRIAILTKNLDSLSHRQIAWLVFLATLCVYFFLTPYVLRDWWLTGDEPHYLLATHSIVRDGDLRLANNYEERDFLGFYVGDDLSPFLQTAEGRDGNLYPIRGPGFSLLLAPAYILGGRAGVALFLDLIGALLAMNFYLLGYEVTRSRLATLVAWVFTFFTPLLVLYNFLLYPEVVGALVLVLALRLIMGTVEHAQANRGGTRDWLLIGLSIASLPWLSTRFIPFSGILFVSALAYGWRDHNKISSPQAIACLLAPCLGSAFLYSAYDYSLFGRFSPFAAYAIAGHNVSGHLYQTHITDVGAAILGFLLDPRRGLFIYAPVYLLSLPGILLLLRQRREDAFLLLPYPTIAYLYTAWTGLYFPGWEISPKFMVSVMPILGIFMACAFTAVKRLSFRTMALALSVIGFVSAYYIIFVDPLAPYAKTIVAKYNRWDRVDLNRYLPHFVAEFFVPGQFGFTGVGAMEGDELQGSLASLPALYRVWIQSVIHTGTSPEDEGYALIADLAKDMDTLGRGAYEAYWFLKIGDNTSQETVAIIDALDPAGEVISRKGITASDFEKSGTYQIVTLPFEYPLEAADRGEPILRLFSTAKADLWIAALKIDAVTVIPRWLLATLWLTGIGIFTVYHCLRSGGKPLTLSRPKSRTVFVGAKERSVLFQAMTTGLVLLIIAWLGNYLLSIGYPRVFEAESLGRLTGAMVADEDASAGKAAYARAEDPEGLLTFGPFEFFRPGEYEARFRIKRGGALAQVEVAAVDVYGIAAGVLAFQTIMSDDFQEADRYHEFRLLFSNPASQALQLRVHFTGTTDLWVDKITLERSKEVGWERKFGLPSPDHPLEATLGEMVRLLGYELERDTVRSGEEIGLTLYWQALAPADRSYKVFTHLIDEENVIWGQHDSQPVGGTYPPNLWVAGEVVADSHGLLVAAEAPADIYRLEVGMYYEPTGERLPAYIEGERVEEDAILLGEIEVVR